MVHPRRTPWSTLSEFTHVHDLVFAHSATPTSQLDALETINVWLARGNCPHAVESTAALLTLVLRDSNSPHHAPHSTHDLRLAYAMAIVRFVNSLVDPLQTTYFARSIASLAQQIQLPLWFVELRHQATHENLPSLGVLRDAARQALDWLYTHYWSAALSSSSTTSTTPVLPPLDLSPLRTLLLTTYKSLSKSTLRDASLVGRTRGEMRACLGEVERWVGENSLGGVGAGRERAWEGVAEVLWSEGGLVPLAKKKRPTPRSPSLSPDLLALWTPLITHLDSLPSASSSSTTFSDVLIKRGLDILCTLEGGETADKSYVACVSAWAGELVKDAPVSLEPEGEEEEGEGGEGGVSLKGVIKSCLLARTPAALGLIDSLFASRSQSPSAAEDAALKDLIDRTTPLLALARQVSQSASGSFGSRVETAEEATRLIDSLVSRSADLASHFSPNPPVPAPAPPSSAAQGEGRTEEWPRRVQGWRKKPIGALPAGGFAGLDLAPLRCCSLSNVVQLATRAAWTGREGWEKGDGW
ncbi:RHTO0S12e04962g1_1 [Rhodotorula toruloides]|uniref:RHTO0S12e04962g1_1 n=1 Tax=Rhodotorula toruloides TaxID=5286 RepID=A0A061B978_RHOTO|nr:RHTO0S12e04962g1_1 [Rhodotorula toruloides]